MKKRIQINVVVTEEEQKTAQILRDKYGINISAVFKILLNQYLEQLENSNIKLEITK